MSAKSLSAWFGMAGVSTSDSNLAQIWGARLDRLMIVLALLTLPLVFIVFDESLDRSGSILYALQWVILSGFFLEFLILMALSRERFDYVSRNWLNLIIIIVSVLSVTGVAHGVWIAIARSLRLVSIGLLAARALHSIGHWLISSGVPIVIGVAVLAWLLSGLGFYFLEPTIHSFGEGLWLAFVSASTVGYGDLVPTTTSSKIFAVLMVFVGFGMFSMIIAVISAYFVGEDEKVINQKLVDDIQSLHTEIRLLREELDEFRRKS